MKLSKRIPGDPVGLVPIESDGETCCHLCAFYSPPSMPMTQECISAPCLPTGSRGSVYYVTAGKAFTEGFVKAEGSSA